MGEAASKNQLVLCIENDGYPASLMKEKMYVTLPDLVAAKHSLIRIVDESGEDYLYQRNVFRRIARHKRSLAQ
jgi:hypothetical protein